MKPNISIIAAAYNEDKNLPPLIKEITWVMTAIKQAYEIIIIEDGSTDNTFSIIWQSIKKTEDY